MIKAIIFDLDDTLIKETDYISSGFNYLSKIISVEHGLNTKSIYSDLKELFEESTKYVYNRLLDKYGIPYDENKIQYYVGLYRNHRPRISLSRTVIKLLKYLRDSGYKIGVITDGYKETQRNKINSLKLENYVDEIIVTDELGREYWKPHPKAFEKIRKKLNIDFNEMVYIGDNPQKDFYISEVHPVKTIRIYTNGLYKESDYYLGVTETYTINDLSDLVKLLKKINDDK